ncbi:DUF6600 domain-containing protein [Olivibacter sitiensis]|uniref:DUF6600 domain-containing protein n=1 Tax=Olivibacter sitiensis TaxID=376470 RepID=UPI000408E72E|nr:DUF6600 domain-containing protein [Olivibacter sitiensis]
METIKKNGTLLLMAILFTIFSFVPKASKAQVGISVSFQQFYNQLSPYGDWIDDPNYGYIWVPRVESGFQPYATNGRWVMTDYGNTWVSNYDWGWAAFHYGRWHYNSRLGWAWVPGYEWAPAWVSWRTGGGYYGWAPLGPGMSIQVNVNLPMNYWTFVPQRYLLSSNIRRYYAPHRSVVNVYQRTTIINNTYVYNNRSYYAGPARRDIQQATRRPVTVHKIADASRPGRGNVSNRTVNMYRPSVDRSDRATARPSQAVNREGISTQRTTNTTPARQNVSSRDKGNVVQRQSSSSQSPTTVIKDTRSSQKESNSTPVRTGRAVENSATRTSPTVRPSQSSVRPDAARSTSNASRAASPNKTETSRQSTNRQSERAVQSSRTKSTKSENSNSTRIRSERGNS